MRHVIVRGNNLPEETARLAREAVLKGLSPFGVETVLVKPGFDHDDDPVLIIQAIFGDNRQPVDGQAFLKLIVDLRAKLAAIGEDRFPHIFMHNADAAPPEAARIGHE